MANIYSMINNTLCIKDAENYALEGLGWGNAISF